MRGEFCRPADSPDEHPVAVRLEDPVPDVSGTKVHQMCPTVGGKLGARRAQCDAGTTWAQHKTVCATDNGG